MWKRKTKRKQCLRCYFGKYQLNGAFLPRRCRSTRGWVWWVSMWNKGRYHRERLLEKDIHHVISEGISQVLRSFSGDFVSLKVECCECLREKTKMPTGKRRGKNVYRIITESIGQLLHACISDSIVAEVKCGECLCEMWTIGGKSEKDIHRVISESISQMLCPFGTDFIDPEAKGGECLWEKIVES